MAGHTSDPGVSVTARALSVLGAFDDSHRRVSLSELAQRSGLPLATAHRLVGELAEWGAVVREEDGRYVVGRRLWDLGLLAPVNRDVKDTASPYLQDLFAATRATVHLAVRDGRVALYLDRVRGSTSVPVVHTPGSRLPLHATGVGKVLLAHAPSGVRHAVLGSPQGLARVTPYTVTRPGTLREQLEQVRRDGYATTSEEMTLGACSLAVPVRSEGEVVAALGVVLPHLRGQRGRLLAAMEVASRGIGRALDRVS